MELLRRAIRPVLGYDSALYRAASQAFNWAAIAQREGPVMARTLSRLAQSARGPAEPLKFRNLEHPIHVRPGTPDIATVLNNIVREEYGHYASARPPLSMIDAGAYIGDSSAYFLSKYPELKITALEPDASNLAMAQQNLAPYGDRVQLLNMALASAPGTVHMSGTHDGATISDDGQAVEATTIPELMLRLGWKSIDILKMDIEGAEADVLGQTADAWLGRVGLLIIELHGPKIERQVKDTLRRNGFGATRYRSLWYCAREALHV